MREIIITGKIDFLIKKYFTFEYEDYIIGVDAACLEAIKQGIKLDLAIGDFDSIKEEDLILVKENCKSIKKLDPIKDETDTLSALKEVLPPEKSKIIMIGGIKGKRIEHFYANVTLLRNYPNLTILDDLSYIYTLYPGTHNIDLDEYKYISLFALETVMDLTLENFKYPLTNYHLEKNDIVGISNEIKKRATITFSSGILLVIKSRNDA